MWDLSVSHCAADCWDLINKVSQMNTEILHLEAITDPVYLPHKKCKTNIKASFGAEQNTQILYRILKGPSFMHLLS